MNFLIALLFAFPVLAEKPAAEESKSITEKAGDGLEKAGEKAKDVSDSINKKLAETRANRESTKYALSAHWTPFEMWTLSDWGISAAYHFSASHTYELDYTRGSLGFGCFGVDLGKITEERFSVVRRLYRDRNSFHFIAGLFLNDMKVRLGNKYLASVAPNLRSQVDLLELQTFGVTLGIGNRWQLKNGAVLGVDWISMNLPLWTIKQKHPFMDLSNNPSYQDDVESAFKVFRRIPALAALRIQVGYSF